MHRPILAYQLGLVVLLQDCAAALRLPAILQWVYGFTQGPSPHGLVVAGLVSLELRSRTQSACTHLHSGVVYTTLSRTSLLVPRVERLQERNA